MVDQWASHLIFQSTLLMRGATMRRFASVPFRQKFQSTLLMRGATGTLEDAYKASRISIHAPHARSDSAGLAVSALRPHFNPRSSCEERRRARSSCCAPARHFNPRSSCEERPPILSLHIATSYFNPRSSCEERRALNRHARRKGGYFNPRSSCEERPSRPSPSTAH